MTFKKPFSIWLIICILVLYGIYLVSGFIEAHSIYFLVPIVLCFSSAFGLALDSNWSKYATLILCILIPLNWFYIVVMAYSNGLPFRGLRDLILSLVPGILVILLCGGIPVVVFRYLKSVKERERAINPT
jgi:hypothetical protein